MVQRFKQLEIEWLNSLSLPIRRIIGQGDIANFNPNHIIMYGEFLLVFSGVKAYSVIGHYCWPEFGLQLSKNVFKIIYD